MRGRSTEYNAIKRLDLSDEPKAAFSTIPLKIADTTELKNAMSSTESNSSNTKRRLYHAQPVKIANAINKFFVTVALKYQSSNDVDLQLTALKEFVRGRNSSAITFDIPEISHSSVFKHLSPLLPTKAPGPDGTCTSVTGSCSSDNRATCQNYKPMYLKESLPYFMETCKSYARVQGGRSSYCWQLQTHQHSACDVYDIRATCSSRIVRVSKPVCPAIQIPDRFQTVLLLQNCHH